jgi:hypothetical protein
VLNIINLRKNYFKFADRIHVRKHFSFISLDNYFALKYGPVASSSLDVLNKQKEYLDNFPESELKHIDSVKKINEQPQGKPCGIDNTFRCMFGVTYLSK